SACGGPWARSSRRGGPEPARATDGLAACLARGGRCVSTRRTAVTLVAKTGKHRIAELQPSSPANLEVPDELPSGARTSGEGAATRVTARGLNIRCSDRTANAKD